MTSTGERQIELKVPQEVADKLKRIADLAGVSMDQLVAVIMATYIVKQKAA